MRKAVLFSGVVPELPRWMYMVRAVVQIVCGISNLFLVPFGRTCNLEAVWQGYMLRSMRKYKPLKLGGKS